MRGLKHNTRIKLQGREEGMMSRGVLVLVCAMVILPGMQTAEAEELKLGVIHLLASHPDHIQLRESFTSTLKTQGYDVEEVVFDANSTEYPDTYLKRVEAEAKRMEAAGVQMIHCTATFHGVKDANIKIPVIDSVCIAPVILGYAEKKADGQIYYKPSNGTGSIFGYAFKDVVKFVKDSLPKAKTIAYVYAPESPISRPPSEIEEAAKEAGLKVVLCPFNAGPGNGIQAMEKAIEEADVAFGTNDMAVFGIEREMLDLAASKNLPVVVGVVSLINAGALAAIQGDWTRAGEMCAEKAIKILKQGTTPNSMPITFPDRVSIGINLQTAQKLGIEIPYEWIEAAGVSGEIVE